MLGLSMTLDAAIAFINASLAPAVIFTGVGLLLAGLQAKYSTLVLVIRQLHRERHGLTEKAREVEMISSQIDSLMRRARLVRNSICSFYSSIFLLILASLLMGFGTLEWIAPSHLVLWAFGAALTALFLGIAFAIREAVLSYHIVQIECRRWNL